MLVNRATLGSATFSNAALHVERIEANTLGSFATMPFHSKKLDASRTRDMRPLSLLPPRPKLFNKNRRLCRFAYSEGWVLSALMATFRRDLAEAFQKFSRLWGKAL